MIFLIRINLLKTINKSCICRPFSLTDRDDMGLYRGPPLDTACQVLIRLAKRFQRRILKCEKLTDRWRTPSDDKISHGLSPGYLKKLKMCHRMINFFLFSSFIPYLTIIIEQKKLTRHFDTMTSQPHLAFGCISNAH